MRKTVIRIAVSALLALLFVLSSVMPAAASGSTVTLKLNKTALELVVGETYPLTVSGADGLRWSSSDEGVVKVDADGNLTGVSAGVATVKVENDGGSAEATVYVVEKEYGFDDNIMISIFWPPTQKYITEEQYQYMEDAGITWIMGSGDNLGNKNVQLKMLQLAYKHGIHMTVGDGRLGGNLPSMTAKQIQKVVDEYKNIPGANGYYMLDEPYNPNDFIAAYKVLKEADPGSYMHLNFLPYASYPSVKTYMSQMNDWLKLCAETGYPQDYLMYDLYPYGTGAGSMNRTGFLINLDAVRKVGLANNVKTATYIQSVCIPGAYRSPNRAETLYEINMALAFGVKQLSYFTWFTPYARSEPFEDGIITSDGKPNPKFEFICELDAKVLRIGKTLISCDAVEVYLSRDRYGSTVEKLPKSYFVRPDNAKNDFTLSRLRDRNTGRNYIMVVNNSFTDAQTFTLKFSEDIKSLQYLSYDDGELHPLEMNDGAVTLNFEAGGAYILAMPEGFDPGTGEAEPQKGENLAKYAQISCDSSTGTGGCYMDHLNDGERFTAGGKRGWRSNSSDGKAVVTVDLGAAREFDRIDLYPAGTSDEYGARFPAAFVVSASEDGQIWEKIAEAENFAIINNTVPSLRFGATRARYIRIEATAPAGGVIELCEIEVYDDDGSVPSPDRIDVVQAPPERGSYEIRYTGGENAALNKDVSVSSYPESDSYRTWGWYPSFLVDGKVKKGWTSDVKAHMKEEYSTEYATIDLGDFFSIDSVTAIPLGCWPVDFNIAVSEDGFSWVVIASEKDSKEPDDEGYTATPESAVKGRYVKFTGTRLRGTSADGYMLQLAEIKVSGTPYKDLDEAERMIAEYVKAGGSENSESCAKVKELMNDANATQSQLDTAMKKMLGEFGLALQPYTVGEAGKDVEYEFKFLKQTASAPDTTAPDTEPAPATEPDQTDPVTTEAEGEPAKTSTAAIVAAVVAGVVIAASAAVIIVTLVKKKK
ncbi:MAG: discoidin domain-containing protein [Clostridia bacterium]|nr:discoidin domain-containing protein [Clostridia bacterium]